MCMVGPNELHHTVLHMFIYTLYIHVYYLKLLSSCNAGPVPGKQLTNMTVNFGPQHPAAHGVLRLVMELSGEVRGGRESSVER